MIRCVKCKTVLESSEIKNGAVIKTRRYVIMLHQNNSKDKKPFCADCGYTQAQMNDRHKRKLQKKQEKLFNV